MSPPIPIIVCLIPVSANARVEGHVSHQVLCLLQTQESTHEKLVVTGDCHYRCTRDTGIPVGISIGSHFIWGLCYW